MIEMNDFKLEPHALRKSMKDAVSRVIDSGWYVLGPELQAFEKCWAQICNTKYSIGVANGMDAIEIALRALNIGKGDEVITTSMTAFATVLAIFRAGAKPVLADIDADTGLMSLASAQRCLTSKSKAVLLVHLYGQLRDLDGWMSFCTQANVELIEDCAQAHLASWRGDVAGSFGSVGAYSFYPTKNLGACGDAGALVTNRLDIAEHAKKLRNYGQSVRYVHPEQGMNSRLDEMQAALLMARVDWLGNFTQRRREIASCYRTQITNTKVIHLSEPQENAAHVNHLYVIKTSERDSLQRHLNLNGVQSFIHYPVPIHHQQPCKDLIIDPKGLLAAERHAEECLSLPCNPQMSDADLNKVVEVVNSFS
jgi:dTDP-4-amino-4,6-dideoxygalactose transaminase